MVLPSAEYLAGMLDADGYISAYHTSTGKTPCRNGRRVRGQLGIVNLWLPLLEVLKLNYGGWIYTDRRGKRPVFRWMIADAQAEKFLRVVYPWLIIKRAQAECFLRMRETMRSIPRNNTRTKAQWAQLEAFFVELKTINAVYCDQWSKRNADSKAG